MSDAIASRLRLLLNGNNWFNPSLKDALTNAAPLMPSGADLQVELLITKDGTALFDYTNCASVTIELATRTSPLNTSVIFSKTIAVDNITTAATLADFNNGSDQAIKTVIENAYTQLGLNKSDTTYTLCIFTTSTDDPARQQPLLVQDIKVVDAGLPIGDPSLPLAFKVGSKLSFLCADAQTRDVMLVAGPGGRWTLNINQAGYNGAGQAVYSLFCGDGNFRDLKLVQQDGVWTLDVGQNGHS